jgi:hypothetical protein
MKRLYLRVALTILAMGCRCAPSFGYCGVPEIRPNGEYFQSDVIFIGTVVSSNYSDAGGFYRLHVRRVFRGPSQSEFDVYTSDDDNRFPLEKKRTYLLFAYRRHGRLEIDSCGNSSLLSEALASIRSLEEIPRATKYGVIEGWPVGETEGVDVSAVRVTIKCQKRNYTAVTDKDGWFHFRVVAGKYKIDFSSGEYYLNAADSFRYNPDNFTLHAGETASLQVVSVRHPHMTTDRRAN